MAKLSEETQAIIDRLKTEGELSRNRGTHSVRSVKIQLDRFEGIFKSISANSAEQTKMMQMQLGMAKRAIEFQKNQEQFDELKRDAEVIQEENLSEGKGRDDTKINAFGDAVKNAFSMKNLAIGAAGLFVGYNVLKGFIDEKTNGGFTKFIDSFKDINWEGFKEKFNGMIAALTTFEEWLGNLPNLLIGGGMVGFAARQAAFGLASGAARGGPRGPRAGMAGLGGIRGTILTAVTGLAIAYGSKVEEYLIEQAGIDPGVASFAVDATQAVLGATTLAMMFGLGPTGIIIGAAVGLAFVVGKTIYNWIKENEAKAAAEAQRRLSLLDEIFGNESGTGGDVGGIIDDAGATDSSALVPSVKTQEAVAIALNNGTLTEDMIVDALEDPAAKQAVGEAIAAAVDDKAIQNGTSIRNLLNNTTEELIGSLGEDRDDVNLDQLLEGFQTTLRSDNPEIRGLAAQAYLRLVGQAGESGDQVMLGMENFGALTPSQQAFFTSMAEFNGTSFRRGSGGFRNFGNGTLSMLHGNEAVINESSPEGQFLRMFEAVVKNKGIGGMEATSGVTLINAQQANPVTVNNVQGAQTQNSLAVIGSGGGGGGNFTASGLPYFAN